MQTMAVLWIVGLSLLGIAGYILTYKLAKILPLSLLILLGVVSFGFTLLWLLIDFYYFHWYDDWAWLLEARSRKGFEFTIIFIGVFCSLIQQNVNKKFKCRDPFSCHNGVALILIIITPSFIKPVLHHVEPGWRESWDEEVCIQTTPYTCGPASAATILKYYGINKTEEEISRSAWLTKHGTEPWHLARIIRKSGLKAKFVSVPSQPADPPIPCIAGVRQKDDLKKGHFITILEKTENSFTIGDPAVGKLKITKEELFEVYVFVGFVIQVTIK
ncbi:hypothetical protein JW926_13070 [Candidatus Sumerlaeota bacterium]|nr:hypothetical protein [Candidatus Sumerlaeota bacterium]